MKRLKQKEFEEMSQLLLSLMEGEGADCEFEILKLFEKLEETYNRHGKIKSARDRLLKLRSKICDMISLNSESSLP